MALVSFHRRVIADGAGPWMMPLRAGLSAMGVLYGAAVRGRNARYDRGAPAYRPAVPVISVGNLTVGGTGKTPMVIALVERLARIGKKPAVLMRGYRADASGMNDEQRLIQRACPGVVCLADPDRCRAARVAVERHGADALVLDDGFQHRRLARDLDLVLIDATCPFGFDRLLPRGLLREPVEGLRRAHAVVITRADETDAGALRALNARIESLCPKAPRLAARHRVAGLVDLEGNAAGELSAGCKVFAFAGIGNPRSFLSTLKRLGAEVVGTRWRPDHSYYSPRVAASLLREGAAHRADVLVTTEKDAVKLIEHRAMLQDRLRIVRIAVEFLDEGDKMMDELLARGLNRAGE
ncbi:MAG: tetraacyldisaccharide 4'-kinase [Phycisphaerales bacterium]|nr:tetraacyldisaccharide 4'-kinase [Phycisphaerales bacterium]